MNYTFNQICSGTKTIKVNGGYHKVIYSICQYDDIVIGNMCLAAMPEAKTEHKRDLTGECPVEAATEMLYWLEQDTIDVILELSKEIA
jgi:hypothetical protein